MARLGNLWLPTDPASVHPTGARDIFDHSPERNRGQPTLNLSPEMLNRVIATAIGLGMPAEIAEQARYSLERAADLAVLWYCVDEASKGNAAAARALDRVRTGFANAPHIAEALDAREQPADARELQQELGLD